MRAEAKEEGGATRKGEGSNETGREGVGSKDIDVSARRLGVGVGVGEVEGFSTREDESEVLGFDFDRSIFCWSFDRGFFFVPSSSSSSLVVVGVLDVEVEEEVVVDFESEILVESFKGFTEPFEGFGVGVGVDCKDSPSIFFVVSLSRLISLD